MEWSHPLHQRKASCGAKRNKSRLWHYFKNLWTVVLPWSLLCNILDYEWNFQLPSFNHTLFSIIIKQGMHPSGKILFRGHIFAWHLKSRLNFVVIIEFRFFIIGLLEIWNCWLTNDNIKQITNFSFYSKLTHYICTWNDSLNFGRSYSYYPQREVILFELIKIIIKKLIIN